MRYRHLDLYGGVVLFIFGLGTAAESLRLPLGSLAESGPGLYPLALGLLLMGLSAALFWQGRRRAPVPGTWGGRPAKLLQVVGASLFLLLALEPLGFRATMIAFLGFLFGWVERRPLWVAAVLAVSISLGAFYLFQTLLQVQLPTGPWGF